MDAPLTTPQAAALLGLSPGAVRQLVARGFLPATKLGRDNLIERAAVDAFQRPRRGNPHFGPGFGAGQPKIRKKKSKKTRRK